MRLDVRDEDQQQQESHARGHWRRRMCYIQDRAVAGRRLCEARRFDGRSHSRLKPHTITPSWDNL